MHLRRRWAVLAFLPLLLLAIGCGSGSDDSASSGPTNPAADDEAGTGEEGGTLVLYSGRNEELVQPLIDDFTEATGIEVEVRYGNSAEMAAQILEEGENTPAEVFFSQEVGAVGAVAKAGLMGDLPTEVVELAEERFRPADGSAWVGITGRSRVIVYNPDLVEEPPAGVMDLTEPAYEGQVAWVPGNAGFQAFVTAFRVSQGEDAARQWLEDMQDNGVVSSYESNGDVLDAVNNGDIAIGLINHYYWARSLPEAGGAENVASELIFPAGDDPGALVNATAAGITVNGVDNPAAVRFVEFLLSEEGQTYFTTETFEYPVVAGIPDPEGIPPLEDLEGPDLDLTDLDSLEETQALLTDVGLLS